MFGGSVFSGFRFGVLAAVRSWDSVLGDCPGVSVVVEAQVDEPPEVDGGDPEGELCPVGFYASISDPSMSVGDDP